jgi:putative salt-induced outer membrane protein
LALPVVAADEDNSNGEWSGSGQLGFSMTSGNSDNESLTAGLLLERESEKWVNNINLDVVRASSDGKDTAERYTLSTRNGYKFDANDYIYNNTRYDKDNFSGFDYTITTSFGWGHQFADAEDYKFSTEIGVGYKIEALDADRTENTGAVLVGKLNYMRAITETLTFNEVLLIESGEDNTFLQNDLGFKFKVNSQFSVKLAHQYRYNTDPAPGKTSYDSLVSANLVYDF